MYNVSNFTTPLDVLFTLGNLIFQCFIVSMLLPSLIFQNFLEALLSPIIKLNELLVGILQTLCDILLFGRYFSNKSLLLNLSERQHLNKRTCSFDKNENSMKSSKFDLNLPKFSSVEKKRCKICTCLCSLATNNSFIDGKNNNKSQFPNVLKSDYTRNNIGTQTTGYKNAFTQFEEHLTPSRLYSNISVQDKNLTKNSKNSSTSLRNGTDCLESSISFYEIDLDNCPDSCDENVEPCKSLLAESLNLNVTKLDTPSNTFDASTSITNQTVLNEPLESPISGTSFRPFESVLLRFSEETVIPTLSPEERSFFKKCWRKVSKLSCFETEKSFRQKNSNEKPKLSTISGERFTSTENEDIAFERDEIFSKISSCCLNVFQGLTSKVKRKNNLGSVAFKRF